MLQYLLQSQSEDPRSRFIPSASGVDGELEPSGSVLADGWIMNAFDGDWWIWLFSASGVAAVLGVLWTIFVILSYLFSFGLLVLYVYASVRKNQYNELEEKMVTDSEYLFDQYYRSDLQPSRLEQVEQHISSGNPNDWKLAIIEADIILDETLKDRGFAGNSLGERLRSIAPSQLQSLNDAWEAHKVRNQIAHEGADFVLTERLARETIQRYKRVFAEFDVR